VHAGQEPRNAGDGPRVVPPESTLAPTFVQERGWWGTPPAYEVAARTANPKRARLEKSCVAELEAARTRARPVPRSACRRGMRSPASRRAPGWGPAPRESSPATKKKRTPGTVYRRSRPSVRAPAGSPGPAGDQTYLGMGPMGGAIPHHSIHRGRRLAVKRDEARVGRENGPTKPPPAQYPVVDHRGRMAKLGAHEARGRRLVSSTKTRSATPTLQPARSALASAPDGRWCTRARIPGAGPLRPSSAGLWRCETPELRWKRSPVSCRRGGRVPGPFRLLPPLVPWLGNQKTLAPCRHGPPTARNAPRPSRCCSPSTRPAVPPRACTRPARANPRPTNRGGRPPSPARMRAYYSNLSLVMRSSFRYFLLSNGCRSPRPLRREEAANQARGRRTGVFSRLAVPRGGGNR